VSGDLLLLLSYLGSEKTSFFHGPPSERRDIPTTIIVIMEMSNQISDKACLETNSLEICKLSESVV